MQLMSLLERLTTGVHAGKVRTNRSVMAVIRVVNSRRSHLKLQKVKQFTYVDVSTLRMARSVMGRITHFNKLRMM